MYLSIFTLWFWDSSPLLELFRTRSDTRSKKTETKRETRARVRWKRNFPVCVCVERQDGIQQAGRQVCQEGPNGTCEEDGRENSVLRALSLSRYKRPAFFLPCDFCCLLTKPPPALLRSRKGRKENTLSSLQANGSRVVLFPTLNNCWPTLRTHVNSLSCARWKGNE